MSSPKRQKTERDIANITAIVSVINGGNGEDEFTAIFGEISDEQMAILRDASCEDSTDEADKAFAYIMGWIDDDAGEFDATGMPPKLDTEFFKYDKKNMPLHKVYFFAVYI
jgi:hypothetical protein